MKKCPFCAEEIQDEAIVCKHCGRDIPTSTPDTTRVERKRNTRTLVFIVIVIVLAIGAWYIKTEVDRINNEIYKALDGDPSSVQVVYKVKGTAQEALITYMNSQGGTEQETSTIPYEKRISSESGAILSLVAQNQGSGTITCEIWIGTKQVKTSTSSAEYGVVTCTHLVGE